MATDFIAVPPRGRWLSEHPSEHLDGVSSGLPDHLAEVAEPIPRSAEQLRTFPMSITGSFAIRATACPNSSAWTSSIASATRAAPSSAVGYLLQSVRRCPLPGVSRCGIGTCRCIRGRDDHPPPLRIALTAVQQFPRRTTGSPINRATSGMPDFGRSQSLFPGSGSPPLPLLITGCQNLATVRVLAPGLEFGCFRSA